MPQGQADPPLSALEHCILNALRIMPEYRANATELAQHTHLPEGTVRYSGPSCQDTSLASFQ